MDFLFIILRRFAIMKSILIISCGVCRRKRIFMREMKDLVVAVVGLRFGATHLKGVIENGATV